MTRRTRDSDDSLVHSVEAEYPSDDELRKLPPMRAPSTAVNSSTLVPFVQKEVTFDSRGTTCRDIYRELFTAAGNRPVHVREVELCACSPCGIPSVDHEDNTSDHPDATAALGRHTAPDADNATDAADEDGSCQCASDSDSDASYSDPDEELLRTRHIVVRKAVRIISRLDKIGSLTLQSISWRHIHPEGRAALCNPAYFRGLSSLGLFNIDFYSSSQLLQLLEIVPALPVETLTMANCCWDVSNHHPDQVASRPPLKLKSLQVNEHHNWIVGSYRALMEWLIGNRGECSIEVVDVVWWSMDFVPVINLLRRVAPGMSRCVLFLVTFDRWDNDRAEEGVQCLRRESDKTKRDEDDIVTTACLPEDIVDHTTWSYAFARQRLLDESPTMEEACDAASQLLREHPIEGCVAQDIEVRYDWTPLAVVGFEALRQMISPQLKSLTIILHIRDIDNVDMALLDTLFGNIDDAMRPVHGTAKYNVDIHVRSRRSGHGGDDSNLDGECGAHHIDHGAKFEDKPELPRLYKGSAKPFVHLHWGDVSIPPPGE